jgi:hypothetical protein
MTLVIARSVGTMFTLTSDLQSDSTEGQQREPTHWQSPEDKGERLRWTPEKSSSTWNARSRLWMKPLLR